MKERLEYVRFPLHCICLLLYTLLFCYLNPLFLVYFYLSVFHFSRVSHKTQSPTGGVAAVCVEGQHLDELVVGAGCQQLTAVAPGHAVDGALVVFVPPEANRRLLDHTSAGGRRSVRQMER